MTQMRDIASEGQPSSSGRGRGTKRPSYPQRVALYNRQVVSELRKVIWPTRSELVTYTVVSVVFVTAMVAFVGFLDYLFTKAVISLFG
ncbi:MAG TPA: preprotein translocase subunit SecE [Mycobacteriales bacterium]|nr:preprotein translocase subunit SecE [Mycobacteriales bacterium]